MAGGWAPAKDDVLSGCFFRPQLSPGIRAEKRCSRVQGAPWNSTTGSISLKRQCPTGHGGMGLWSQAERLKQQAVKFEDSLAVM